MSNIINISQNKHKRFILFGLSMQSTPSFPAHTIAWAKELCKLMFSNDLNNSMIFEDTLDNSDKPSAFMDIILN